MSLHVLVDPDICVTAYVSCIRLCVVGSLTVTYIYHRRVVLGIVYNGGDIQESNLFAYAATFGTGYSVHLKPRITLTPVSP